MFILRRITGEGHEVNQVLGKEYHYVDGIRNETEFEKALNVYGGTKEENPSIYAFLTLENGKEMLPLHRPSTYYIMTENGATFANLTFK